MPQNGKRILIVDDDPYHLEIYGLLVKQGGYEPVPALVRFVAVELPEQSDISLILLDYNLNSSRSPVQIARELQSAFPSAPILLLSDVWSMPDDMIPLAAEFVRKGEPAKLLSTLKRMLGPGEPSSAQP